jgi:Zn-dependent peptidase ImmA (M78 family)/predicted secreted protein
MADASQLKAAQAATQLLVDLDIDQSVPIDPFEAIDNMGLELRFERLGGLLGAIVPGDPSGVMINMQFPASVQRFTAGHEIGHWVLDQDSLALDTEDTVEGLPKVARERNAQTFAAHFLMPLELMYATADRYGVEKGGAINPGQVYSMARDMHVSYSAAVHQLANTHFIPARARGKYLAIAPAVLKASITHGRKPFNARGDVWELGSDDEEFGVEVFMGDEIVVNLPENPSTGYTWMPREAGWQYGPTAEASGDLRVLETVEGTARDVPSTAPPIFVVSDAFENTGDVDLVGGPGTRIVGLAAARVGDWSIRMRHVRPFAPGVEIEGRWLQAHVRALPKAEVTARWLATFVEEDRALAHIEIDTAQSD